MLLDVSPSLSGNDIADSRSADTESFGNACMGVTGGDLVSDLANVIFSEFGHPMTASSPGVELTTLCRFGRGLQVEVLGVATSDSSTCADDPKFVKDLSVGNLPCNSLGRLVLSSLVMPDETIFESVFGLTDPWPTCIRPSSSVDIMPESFFKSHADGCAFSSGEGAFCNLRPGFSLEDPPDSNLINFKSCGKSFETIRVGEFTDFENLFFGELGHMVSPSSTFLDIAHVLSLGADVEVIWIAAWRVVASMEYGGSFPKDPIDKLPSNPMGSLDSLSVPKHSVSEFVDSFSCPDPTWSQLGLIDGNGSVLVDVTPQSFLKSESVSLDLLDDERVAVLLPGDVMLATVSASVCGFAADRAERRGSGHCFSALGEGRWITETSILTHPVMGVKH